MGRTPYDTYAKELTVEALSPWGRAESDVRISPDPTFADVCFEPASPPDGSRGDLLHRLTSEGVVMLEFARQAPDVAEMGTWLGKQLGWWRRLQAAARREEGARWKLPPLFWGLSSGAPREALDVFRMERMDEAVWPRGCYEGAPGGRFRSIVISELPRERETLVVRTMGAGVTFQDAMADLAALPADAPERLLVLPHLARLTLQMQNEPDDEAREMVMQAQKLYDELMEKQLMLGMDKGLEKGLEKGLRPLARQFERRLARPLTAAEQATLVARMGTVGPDRLGDVVLDLDPAALSAWLADPAAR